jgi:hypothetical protein
MAGGKPVHRCACSRQCLVPNILLSRRSQRSPYLQHGATGPPRGRRGLSGRNALPHAPLQADRDQLLCLDRELHRQVLQHVPDEAIDNQSRCFLSR